MQFLRWTILYMSSTWQGSFISTTYLKSLAWLGRESNPRASQTRSERSNHSATKLVNRLSECIHTLVVVMRTFTSFRLFYLYTTIIQLHYLSFSMISETRQTKHFRIIFHEQSWVFSIRIREEKKKKTIVKSFHHQYESLAAINWARFDHITIVFSENCSQLPILTNSSAVYDK